MIEAVNSAVANASLLRTNGEQSQQTRLSSIASSTDVEARVELQLAPFVSPFIEMDTNFNKAVLQIRDSSTGEVQRQFPSETTMRARAAQAEIETQSVRQAVQSSQSETNSPRIERSDTDTQASSAVVQAGDSGLQVPSTTSNAQSQIAAAAFAAGALSGSIAQSGGVSVLA